MSLEPSFNLCSTVSRFEYKIQVVTIPSFQIQDKLVCGSSNSGDLFVADCVNFYRCKAIKVSWANLIWQNHIPPKLPFFFWRLVQNRLPTDAALKHCGISLASRVFCFLHKESVSHLLVECLLLEGFGLWWFAIVEFPFQI